MEYNNGKFVWFEHMSGDVAKARTFYNALFDWTSDPIPMGSEPYHMIQNAGSGIGGFRKAQPGMAAQWMSYLSVANVDAGYLAATGAGGTGMMPPVDFGGEGRAAGVIDPTGASFCLWKGAHGDQPDVLNGPDGGFIWNELWTSSTTKALAFYKGCFGYNSETVDMGNGAYHLLIKDGKRRAGMMGSVNPKARSMWLPYVKVADCDATSVKAELLGGQVAFPPMEIPNIGRFAILIDTTGVPLAVMKPVPM